MESSGTVNESCCRGRERRRKAAEGENLKPFDRGAEEVGSGKPRNASSGGQAAPPLPSQPAMRLVAKTGDTLRDTR